MRRKRAQEAAAPKENQTEIGELTEQLRIQNQLLRDHINWQTNWKMRVFQGLMFGLGSFLGATILVSLVAYMLKPLLSIDALKPGLSRVLDDLEKPGMRGPLVPTSEQQYHPDSDAPASDDTPAVKPEQDASEQP